jgi:hypothetical protein
MRKSIGATALALALGLAAAGAASAQDAAPAAPAAAPAAATQPSVDWTIADLLANPAAKSVLEKDLPALEGDPRLDMVKAMSLRAVSQFPEAQIDQAKLDSIQADLTAIPTTKPAS